MRLLRGLVILMTGLAIAGTLYEAAWGDRIGVVIAGLLVAWAGIIVIALTDPGPRGGR